MTAITQKPIMPMDTIATDELGKLAMENVHLETKIVRLIEACHSFEGALNFARLALDLLLYANGGTIEVAKRDVDEFMELLKVYEYTLDSAERDGNLVFILNRKSK
jgi:hypothetical protein